MPIVFTHKLAGTYNSTSTGAWTTSGTYTPTANTLQLAAVILRSGAAITQDPTLTGCGLTWVLVRRTNAAAATDRGFALFRAMGSSPSDGSLTLTMGGAEQITRSIIVATEVSGTATTGTNGADAIAQTVDGNASTGSPSMAITMVDAANALFGAFGTFSSAPDFNAGSGYTRLTNTKETSNHTLGTEARTTSASAIDGTWSSGSPSQAYIGVEIVEGTPPPAPSSGHIRLLFRAP
jgi:hypothetical protein